MKRNKIFLIVQSALCILLALLLAAAVLGVFREGLAAKAENPLTPVFSREKLAERFRPIRPLFVLTLALAVGGLLLHVKDEDALKQTKGGRVQTPAPMPKAKALRTLLLIAAGCLILAGVFNGGALDVFGKAVKVCTECVGLG